MATATIKQMTWDQFEEVLAAELPGFARREIQAALAKKALSSVQNQRHILAQAGCGTGKSFIAAFVALMQSLKTGKPVAIATATKALQDQYSEKDLPFLASILEGLRYAVLKGRSNYVCMAKVDELPAGEKSKVLAQTDVEGFSGERLDLVSDVEDKLLVATSDECPGKSQCPFGDVCFAERAKDKARTAHIVVVNHAVLAADMSVRKMQEEIGVPADKVKSILPELGGVIVDEAHEFLDSVTSALGGEITSGSYGRLFKEICTLTNDRKFADATQEKVSALFGRVGQVLAKREDKRSTTLRISEDLLLQISEDVLAMIDSLTRLEAKLGLVQFHGDDKSTVKKKRLMRRIEGARSKLHALILAPEDELVRWLEAGDGRKGDAIGYAPLVVDEFLREMLWNRMTGMLMSATLALGNDFSFIQEQLGID